MRIVIALFAHFLIAGAAIAANGDGVVPAPADDSYRADADLRLTLVYQGTAEGGFSRTLRFFGGGGRCEAWYDIAEVMTAPPGHGIAAGDRLRLQYGCGEDRAFRPGPGGTVTWGRPGPRPQDAVAWLRARDIERDRHGTWLVPNPHDWFAPLAVDDD